MTLYYNIVCYIALYCITLYFIRSVGNYGKHRSGEIYIKICYINIEQENLVPIMISTCLMVTMVNKIFDSHGIPTANQRRLNGELEKKNLRGMMVSTGKYPYELGLSAVERNIVI